MVDDGEEEGVHAEPMCFVRVSRHPPPTLRDTVSTDLELLLKRFDHCVRQTGIPEDQWAAQSHFRFWTIQPSEL